MAAMRSAGRIILIAALVLSVGLHWAALQSAAWVGMIVSYSHDGSVAAAIGKTFDGEHPCRLCKLVEDGTSQEQEQRSEKSQVKKIDLATVAAALFITPPEPPALKPAFIQAKPPARPGEPPTPPPRAIAA